MDAIVAEATIDCCDDDEHLTGLFTMLEEHLAGRHRQTVGLLDLPLPDPTPDGAE